MCIGEDSATCCKALAENRINHRATLVNTQRCSYRRKAIGNKIAPASPFDGRYQLCRELRLAVRYSFEGQVPRAHALVPLRHICNNRLGIYSHPPRSHLCCKENLLILCLSIGKVILLTDCFVVEQTLLINLFGQFAYHRYLFGSCKVYEVIYGSHEYFVLLSFTLCCKVVVITQYAQCLIKVQRQASQCSVNQE
nr:MAG TPA: hypothetical protein [Caudoviricetes sp.]